MEFLVGPLRSGFVSLSPSPLSLLVITNAKSSPLPPPPASAQVQRGRVIRRSGHPPVGLRRHEHYGIGRYKALSFCMPGATMRST